MAIIIKNQGDNPWVLRDTNPGVTVPAESQIDLETVVPKLQLVYSQQLLTDIANSELLLVVNDGGKDLTLAQALWHIFGIGQQFPISNFGRLQVENYKAGGDGITIVSHDFTKPCAWFQNSLKVENEELTNPDRDGYCWRSQHKWWIDLFHGLYPREGTFNADYKVKVEVSLNGGEWVEKIEGHDFVVDYQHGEIIVCWHNPFLSDCAYADPSSPPPMMGMGPLDPQNDKLRATYHHSGKQGASMWALAPSPGKVLRIEKTEIQFTQDVLLHTAMVFCPFMTNPADPGGPKIPLVSELAVYKGGRDFVSEGNQGTGTIEPFGGGTHRAGITVRGLRHGVSVFPFDYLKTKDLLSSYGMELRIWALNDIPLDGEYANVTCYCSEEDDPHWQG